MRLGFQSPSPFERIKIHDFGSHEWEVSITPKRGGVLYSTTSTRAFFSEDNPASLYVDHPGHISMFARIHMALGHVSEKVTLRSWEVENLLSDFEGDA